MDNGYLTTSILKEVQIFYCKSTPYKSPSQNTPHFSWNITPIQITFALHFQKQTIGLPPERTII
jgi:hypothetical protein